MNQALLDKIEAEQYRKNKADFGIGDTVRVHTRVVEGDKERIQIFFRSRHRTARTRPEPMFTVRRISYGEGVERVFPSTRRAKIEVERKGAVRRAKLTYLRKRVGKAPPWSRKPRPSPRRPECSRPVGGLGRRVEARQREGRGLRLAVIWALDGEVSSRLHAHLVG